MPTHNSFTTNVPRLRTIQSIHDAIPLTPQHIPVGFDPEEEVLDHRVVLDDVLLVDEEGVGRPEAVHELPAREHDLAEVGLLFEGEAGVAPELAEVDVHRKVL